MHFRPTHYIGQKQRASTPDLFGTIFWMVPRSVVAVSYLTVKIFDDTITVPVIEVYSLQKVHEVDVKPSVLCSKSAQN